MPTDNIKNFFLYVSLQFVPIFLNSIGGIIYLIKHKPYKTFAWNAYMITTEALYFTIVIQIFIFVDDTPSLRFKFFASITLIVAIIALVSTSLAMTIYLTIKGN